MAKQIWKPGNMLYPLPAVMISCQRQGEKPNILTVAWTGTICSDPAMVSISVRPERYSHAIIKETKEFVINLTTQQLCYATDYCGVRSGRDVDKFKEMHLTPLDSQKIKAPGIKESPVNIECKVQEVKHLGTHDMFIARVVSITVDDEYLDEKGRFDLNSANLITYSHGEYFELGKKIGKFGFSVNKKNKKTMNQAKDRYEYKDKVRQQTGIKDKYEKHDKHDKTDQQEKSKKKSRPNYKKFKK